MKLWKCDVMEPIEGLLSVTVVVMAETRQQAIEEARAKVSAKLPEALGQMFPAGDDRRFAQLGPDALEDIHEACDEVVIVVVGLPVMEDGTDATRTGAA